MSLPTTPAARIGKLMIDSLLLCATRIHTFVQEKALSNASGFFFERNGRLYLVTSRHVLFDEPGGHHPDRIEIELHTDGSNMTRSTGFSVPLYRNARSIWRQGEDAGGAVDVAIIELLRSALPATMVYRAFGEAHLERMASDVEIGSPLLVVGFPLGFHDDLHHLPVVRQAINASPFGLRFQGLGYFLTDARTHRGTSGAPVVSRSHGGAPGDLPWRLLGVHSARLDAGTRDATLDEALGLNCAWYADILLSLTRD